MKFTKSLDKSMKNVWVQSVLMFIALCIVFYMLFTMGSLFTNAGFTCFSVQNRLEIMPLETMTAKEKHLCDTVSNYVGILTLASSAIGTYVWLKRKKS